MRVLGVESVSDPKQYTKLWVCKCVEYVYIYVAKTIESECQNSNIASIMAKLLSQALVFSSVK